MRYEAILHKLYQIATQKKVALGLEVIKSAYEIMGRPAECYPTIHIAGTNGKGSVATKLAEIFRISGYRVGLYTSPHIDSYRERIQVDGQWISKSDAVDILQEIFNRLDQNTISLTFFEYTTILSLLYFQRKKVDIAIIETGLGGRLDATNLITPILSVITTISLDHTDYLGSTIDDIAQEKAGIIKAGIPVVIGPKAYHDSIKQQAFDKKCEIAYVSGCSTDFFDHENQQIVKECIQILSKSYVFSQIGIQEGIYKRPPCRFSVKIYGEETCVFDVAHNPEALGALSRELRKQFPGKLFRFLINFSSSKDTYSCLKVITNIAHHVHIVPSSHARIASVKQIVQGLNLLCYRNYSCHPSMKDAVKVARQNTEVVVVTGSFYIMSEVQEEFEFAKSQKDSIALSEIV